MRIFHFFALTAVPGFESIFTPNIVFQKHLDGYFLSDIFYRYFSARIFCMCVFHFFASGPKYYFSKAFWRIFFDRYFFADIFLQIFFCIYFFACALSAFLSLALVTFFQTKRKFVFSLLSGRGELIKNLLAEEHAELAFLIKENSLPHGGADSWANARIVAADEVSSADDLETRKLDRQLKQCCGDRSKPFGGLSAASAGSFQQLEPPGAEKNQLLFSGGALRENTLSAAAVLESDHRSKGDPKCSRLLHRMRPGDPTEGGQLQLNERAVGPEQVPILPSQFGEKDARFACPTNKERSAVSTGNSKCRAAETCPDISPAALPPERAVATGAVIQSLEQTSSSRRQSQWIGGSARHQILAPHGSASAVASSKKRADPALCLHASAHAICTAGSANLSKEVPRGNGTWNSLPCRWLETQRQLSNAPMEKICEKKVWPASAAGAEAAELEHCTEPPGIQLLKKMFGAQGKPENADLTSQEKKNTRQDAAKLLESLGLAAA